MRKYLTLGLGILLFLVSSLPVFAETHSTSLKLAQSEYELGSLYFYGRGVKKDNTQALNWYLKSAEKGHAKSELAVSQVLAFGDNRNRRFQESLPWLIKAAGPHETPQISGMKAAQTSAKKNLRWMCKKGLVDFPDSHPYAHDPKCWLKRGNRLFIGSSRIDYYLMKDKSKYYGIEKDVILARHYLEKAFNAGEEKASINLAKIYGNGIGVPKDPEKFAYYLDIAGEIGDAKSNYHLAEQALNTGNDNHYFEKLKSASKKGHTKASSELAWAYFKGEKLEKNYHNAFMYFFLAGKRQYVRNRDPRHGDTRLPFFENTFLSSFQTEISAELLDKAHQEALNFAKENKFKSYRTKKITYAYNIAISDLEYVQETGGEWYKSNLFSNLSYYFLFFVLMYTIRGVAGSFIQRG